MEHDPMHTAQHTNAAHRTDLSVLDRALTAIENGEIATGFARLIDDLDDLRRTLDVAEWTRFVRHTFRNHPLHDMLRHDPFTRHAFDKPRGYAGDAELIDYIYGYGDGIVLPACTSRGRSLYAAAMETVPCRAVRARRLYLGRHLEQLGKSREGARVLSVAAGHMRELSLAPSARQGRFAELIALDQDDRSLATIDEDYADVPRLRTMPGRVRSLLTGKLPIDGLDLCYSTGLFDYLNQRTARALTNRMFDMLRPGGELIIANFKAGVSGVGYMEACMDWHLVYRGEDAMRDLADALPADQVDSIDVRRDSTGGILFLHVRRRA